jgi:sulfoxide reductase catalytic subunit YedY
MTQSYDADVPSHDVTPEAIFLDRRRFLAALGAGIAGAGSMAFPSAQDDSALLTPPYDGGKAFPAARNEAFQVPEAIERKALTPREVAAAHNNFYEFLPGRGGPVWRHASDFQVKPWQIEIDGECAKPQTFDLDLSFPQEERIYHFRCVERWAMNVPWSGFPLKKLLLAVEPKSTAKYVRFVSAVKRDQMPGVQEAHWYPWPYQRASLDEAMNDPCSS